MTADPDKVSQEIVASRHPRRPPSRHLTQPIRSAQAYGATVPLAFQDRFTTLASHRRPHGRTIEVEKQ
jgi:hypothetical protein